VLQAGAEPDFVAGEEKSRYRPPEAYRCLAEPWMLLLLPQSSHLSCRRDSCRAGEACFSSESIRFKAITQILPKTVASQRSIAMIMSRKVTRTLSSKWDFQPFLNIFQ